MSWIWNAFQQMQIRDGQQRVSDAGITARSAQQAIAELEEKVDRLSLICHALFEEIERTTGFTEIQLKQKMLEIDMRDGNRDGKYDPVSNQKCPECGHTVKNRRDNCFWCGASLSALGK